MYLCKYHIRGRSCKDEKKGGIGGEGAREVYVYARRARMYVVVEISSLLCPLGFCTDVNFKDTILSLLPNQCFPAIRPCLTMDENDIKNGE